MICQYMLPVGFKISQERGGERGAALRMGVSRSCLRDVIAGSERSSLASYQNVVSGIGHRLTVLSHPAGVPADLSTVAISHKILRDGFLSWKIHVFEFVDYFRRTLDSSLILLPPLSDIDSKLKALIAGVVIELCHEIEIVPPDWSLNGALYLREPWFPADIDNLKAIAIAESPYGFRRHNIFVHNNFLSRV